MTNRRVAREAEVSLGSITYHFATQHELLREAMLLFVAAETARLSGVAEQHLAAPVSLETAAAMVEQVALHTRFGHEEIAPLELYIQAGRDPCLRDAAAECFAAYDRIADHRAAGAGRAGRRAAGRPGRGADRGPAAAPAGHRHDGRDEHRRRRYDAGAQINGKSPSR